MTTQHQPIGGRESRGLDQTLSRVELRSGNSEGEMIITGYAAVFYREGDTSTEFRLSERIIERIYPGAFDGIEDDDVCCLFNHKSELILGRSKAGTARMIVDEIGLRYECDLPDTTTGRDLVVSLNRGDVQGSSFGFKVRDGGETRRRSSEHDGFVRELRSVRTVDAGPVTHPAYEATSSEIARRSLDEWEAEQIAEAARIADHRRRRAARIRHGC